MIEYNEYNEYEKRLDEIEREYLEKIERLDDLESIKSDIAELKKMFEGEVRRRQAEEMSVDSYARSARIVPKGGLIR